MLAVLVNFGTIMVGGFIGLFAKNLIPKRLEELLIKAMGLAVIYIGIKGMLDGENALIAVISLAVGGVIGGLIDLDGKLERGSKCLEKKLERFDKKGKNEEGGFAKGFSAATLLFMIGAMAIVGSINAGLSHDYSTLITKAIIDGVTAIVFASTLGWGVIASCIPVTIYQGAICLLAGVLAPYLQGSINEINAVGSILIMAIGMNLIGITKIKVMNLMPAMFIPIILCLFM